MDRSKAQGIRARDRAFRTTVAVGVAAILVVTGLELAVPASVSAAESAAVRQARYKRQLAAKQERYRRQMAATKAKQARYRRQMAAKRKGGSVKKSSAKMSAKQARYLRQLAARQARYKRQLAARKKPASRIKTRPLPRGWRTAKVSWYGPGFYGRGMAGGGKLQVNSMVVAHKTLPFGTKVQFWYNGRTVTVPVKDRGPYVKGREFDLGPGTARYLGMMGVGTVQYRVLGR